MPHSPLPRLVRIPERGGRRSLPGEREEGSPRLFRRGVPVLGSLLKEMQKDMDEKMDVLINTQKNNKP